MSRPTLRALLGGSIMALHEPAARWLLEHPMPQAMEDDEARGPVASAVERFAVERSVAVVPVRGVLTPNSAVLERWFGWATYRGLIETCEQLASDEAVSAVVLELDTPGGAVLGCAGAAAAIAELDKVKPVHALVDPLAASAGFWLASQAREISVAPGAELGSIGAGLMTGAFVQPGAGTGLQLFEFTSPHARAKWPDPSTEEGKAELERSLAEAETRFHEAAAAGRGMSVEDLRSRASVSDDPRDGGALFDGAEAISRGLADQVETRRAFYTRILGTYAPAPRKARSARSRGASALALAAQASALS
ncbi:serine protease, ClpP class [Pseudooceanicola antarcticus]|uniref:Peptidase S49 n=1 Tax=Pseudooceanicola antarcticus TaxID=1247613 RepID=A0A285J581_9RHOB|nr:S49 family peptidase [Pseudooceanicola antarcticus]PJE26820.1 peptidase S49 [Pseudooceanicola antarcticus]SNY55372.1 serine protease, ClpP class [Pseudooceanicola antarcticus]